MRGPAAALCGRAGRLEIDIRNVGNTATLRTISTTSPVAAYTAAEQTADFGAPQASIVVRIYQISAIVGRGIAARATL
jgi:hypothetical protein